MTKVIVLDPGHGGSSTGSVGNGLVEKVVVLSFAQRLKQKFEAYECEVILTRTGDISVSLEERAAIANRNNADYFISIHCNGASSSSANGYEDYIHTSPLQASINYQDIIHRHAAAVWVNAGRANRGKKRANFYVLRETNMPAILLENGFLTNARDAELLKDPAFTGDLLDAIVAGIVEALDIPKKSNEPQQFYRVQAGAFSTRAQAEEQVRRLNQAGFDAFIINPDQEAETEPPEDGNEPDTPVIYVDQQLIIPVSGNGSIEVSRVVKEGILSGDQKRIALTFDAGWLYDQTVSLLDVLEKYQVKSTFFPRALWVRDHTELAREIVNRGHIIENHSLTHGDMSKMTDQQIVEELRESTRILKEVTNSDPYLFRPPYGAYDNRMLKILAQEGYPYTILWTVDTHDWAHEIGGQKVTADYLVDRVLSSSSANGIILMHVGGYKTVEALPRIIIGLRDQGYKLVTVNEMMPSAAESVQIHTVRQGETLFSIAQQYGVTIEQIIRANNL